MRTKIQKWGNSLAVRIPRGFALDAKLKNNSEVDIQLVNNEILIKPLTSKNKILEKLLSDIKNDNIHDEVYTGSSTGNEIW